ncbi:hypothetical protein TrCOL_g8830 [Triparma columacea]|uniref:Uncharacterized protein n=1 Tax=Triparma columacea TaxID=722753 RepID=A0A9W7GP55_9STRA|nr:hypothetical protein TrCOL_g8830 [Triparma columacea]
MTQGYELFDYANAEYSDQGDLDTFPSNSDKTELEIEEMREERRRKNDEFQFETFYKDFVGEEEEWRGEWTRYETTTFLPNEAAPQGGMPQLVKPIRSTKAITTALRTNPSGDKSTTHDYITQSEYHITDESADTSLRTTVTRDPSTNFGANEPEKCTEITRQVNEKHYAPRKMRREDFRGPQGNMCVGNAYTTAYAVNNIKGGSGKPTLEEGEEGRNNDKGPFSELYMELGIRYGEIRFRLKLDYSTKRSTGIKGWGVLGSRKDDRLWLVAVTVCRERLGKWPTQKEKAFKGPKGAPGGLFDQPKVGLDRRDKYMQLDLEGYASTLFPFVINQDSKDEGGWVVSLDWTPGKMRYQADRKFLGGENVKGLRTLELSEVKAEQAEEYRPRGGPEDMRQ